jgi:chromosome segregation ATPase
LRISEQDHYNQIKITLEKIMDSKDDVSTEISELTNSLQSIKNISDSISKSIVKNTLQQLSSVTIEFEKQIVHLKSHTEGINTSLSEGEDKLNKIRQESELIMKQMSLSAKKMDEIEKQNSGLHNIYETIKELMKEIEIIKVDYVRSQAQLSLISKEFQLAENEQIDEMKIQIENLSETLAQRIDDSLKKLHEHYHIADDDISQSVQLLAKRAQIQKGYSQLDG